jgi:hypothetical protein
LVFTLAFTVGLKSKVCASPVDSLLVELQSFGGIGYFPFVPFLSLDLKFMLAALPRLVLFDPLVHFLEHYDECISVIFLNFLDGCPIQDDRVTYNARNSGPVHGRVLWWVVPDFDKKLCPFRRRPP